MLSPRYQSLPDTAHLDSRPLVDVQLPVHPGQLSVARHLVDEAAGSFGLTERDRFEFVFAVNEAMTNAVRHGPQHDGATIALRIDADDRGLAASVRSGGSFRTPEGLPDPWAEGGRGFHYMRVLMDEVRVQSSTAGTAVHLYKASPAARCAHD